jgi:hypothetical protein
MPLRFQTSRTVPDNVDALVVGVFGEQIDEGNGLDGVDVGFLTMQGFKGGLGEVRSLPGSVGGNGSGAADGPAAVVAVGLGERAAATASTYRRAGAALA